MRSVSFLLPPRAHTIFIIYRVCVSSTQVRFVVYNILIFLIKISQLILSLHLILLIISRRVNACHFRRVFMFQVSFFLFNSKSSQTHTHKWVERWKNHRKIISRAVKLKIISSNNSSVVVVSFHSLDFIHIHSS